MNLAGKVGFCVGTGRCGTTFIAQLASLEPSVAASHERLRLPATFHMYCKWHGIEVDCEGFLSDRDAAIAEDLRDHDVSFESSALLSHSVAELFERYNAKFVLLVRRPDETVASFAARGWFLDPIPWRDSTKPPTITEGANPRHFFGRNLPRGDEFARWTELTQIGKLAWFWNARNSAILEQFRHLPSEQCRIVRLEDFDYPSWSDTAEFLGWQATVDRAQFEKLAGSRPNAGPNKPIAPRSWSEDAAAEFETELGPLASAFGYEHRVDELLSGADACMGGPPTVADVLART
jgi:hypothetical protein